MKSLLAIGASALLASQITTRQPRSLPKDAEFKPLPLRTSLIVKGPPRTFRGRVVAEWLDDNRQMRLVEDFGYFDDRGILWDAPKGA